MKKKTIHTKVQAGALQYTIFVSVVIALLLFAFIALTHVQQQLSTKNRVFSELIETSNLGFNHLKDQETPYSIKTNPKALHTNNPDVEISKTHWGIFDLLRLSSTKKNENFTKVALLGGQEKQPPALYLQDENQPLVLVGNTRIEGKVSLPKKGVKRGSIAGHSYTGSQLIYGSLTNSKGKLPIVDKLVYLKDLKKEILENKNKQYIEVQEGQTVFNSFTAPTKVWRTNGTVTLRNTELTGNIIVQASSKITVHASSRLKEVILIAPEIEILPNTKGRFQAFASKKIKLGAKSILTYPSALVLLENEHTSSTQNKNVILIDKGAELRGLAVYSSVSDAENYTAQIILEENAIVLGEVYCSQNFELKGTVKGSVYTKGFIANQFGSIYKNHIYNGTILGTALPEQYAGLAINKTKPAVAKWLY